MRLELAQVPHLAQTYELRPEQRSKVYELLDYWTRQDHIESTVKFQDREINVKYCFAPQSWLNAIHEGEKFGAYTGDMMFISSELREQKPWAVPYVLLKLTAERFVDPGLDKSGKAKHFAALFATIRVAGMKLPKAELTDLLADISQHETTGYLELDAEVKEFMDSCGGEDKLAVKRRYLENHNYNKWVIRGRNDEALATLSPAFDGYRNHAEAIISVMDDLDTKNLYLAAEFMHTLSTAVPNTPLLIHPPHTSFAYALTKESNGKADIVRFKRVTQRVGAEDIIILLPKKERTLTAVRKRLSRKLSTLERRVQNLIESSKEELDGLLIEATKVNEEMGFELQTTHALMKTDFEGARENLETISTKYPAQLARLDQVSKATTQNMAKLEELAKALRAQI